MGTEKNQVKAKKKSKQNHQSKHSNPRRANKKEIKVQLILSLCRKLSQHRVHVHVQHRQQVYHQHG